MIVKLVDTEEFPKHGENPVDGPFADWKKWRGQEIRVSDAAYPPASTWNCGTRAVYRIPEDEVQRIHGGPPRAAYVCEHQIVLPEGK